jgi:PTH2 family peptidyl-tRNA hydrolase
MEKPYDPDKPKQVIVVRKDLKMRKGKMAAQVAHASLKVFFDKLNGPLQDTTAENQTECMYYEMGNFGPSVIDWIEGEFTKIVVGCDGEPEINRLEKVAKTLGIPHAKIIDNGHTEFNGQKTVTCIAIGPARAALVDDITGGFKLL